MTESRQVLGYMGAVGAATPFYKEPRDINSTGHGFVNAKPYVKQKIEIAASNSNYGSEIKFDIHQICDLIGCARLSVNQAAGTGTGAYFGDFQLYSQIDVVEWHYNGQLIQRHSGRNLKKMLQRQQSEKIRQGEALLQNGFLSVAERKQRFATAQVGLSCDLFPDWADLGNHLPIVQLPTALKCTVRFLPDAKRVRKSQSGSVAIGAISDPKLIIDGVHLLEEERDMLWNRTGHPNGEGWMIKSHQRQEVLREPVTQATVSANALVEHTVKLNQVTNTVYALYMELQYQDCIDNQLCLNPDATIPIYSYHLTNQNVRITDIFYGDVANKDGCSRALGLYIDNAKRFPDRHIGDVENVYAWGWDELHQRQRTGGNMGGITGNRLNSLELRYTVNGNYASATPWLDEAALQATATTIDKTKWYITVEAECHQLVFAQGGDLRRYLAN